MTACKTIRLSIPGVAVFLSLFLPFVSSMQADPAVLSPAYQPYSPMSEDDYVQVWNLNFSGPGTSLQLLFMVSNVGPGDRNNGSALIVYDRTGSRSYTAEHTDASLHAVPGQFGIKSAANELRMAADRTIRAYAEFPGAKLRLVMTPRVSGPVFPDWRLKGNDFFRIGLPVLDGAGTITLERDGKTLNLEGRASMDTILSNALPHRYAKRLFLFRGPGSALMTGFQDREGHYRLKLFARGKKGNWQEETITDVQESRVETEPYSLYRLPATLMVRTSRCGYEFGRKEFSGGMYVFESISPFLRWVLRLFFSKPFVLNYQGSVRDDCTHGKEAPLLTSFFILGE